MKIIQFCFFAIIVSLSFHADANHSATILDQDGNEHQVEITTIEQFRWGNRRANQNSELLLRRGNAFVIVNLTDIRKIEFMQHGAPAPDRAIIELTMTTGEKIPLVYRTSLGYNRSTIRGIDSTFGQEFGIRVPNVRSIYFHERSFKQCPTTGARFLNPDYSFSPYTGERLERVTSTTQ